MSKLKLLILDANVIIHLHEFGIWGKLLGECEVHLARTVVEDEASYFEKDDERHPIDLGDDVAQGRVQVFEVPLSDINRFRSQFDPLYVGELDPGETEALAHLTQVSEPFLIASGDAIVYRVLGLHQRPRTGDLAGGNLIEDRPAPKQIAVALPEGVSGELDEGRRDGCGSREGIEAREQVIFPRLPGHPAMADYRKLFSDQEARKRNNNSTYINAQVLSVRDFWRCLASGLLQTRRGLVRDRYDPSAHLTNSHEHIRNGDVGILEVDCPPVESGGHDSPTGFANGF